MDIRLKLDVPPASPYLFLGPSAKKRAEKKRQLGTRGGWGEESYTVRQYNSHILAALDEL